MIRARVHAHALSTLLAGNAIIVVSASGSALSLVAHITATVQVGVADAVLTDTSVLGASEGSLEAQRAVAHRLTVDDFTESVRSASRLARVHAAAMQAGGILRAISVTIRAHAL